MNKLNFNDILVNEEFWLRKKPTALTQLHIKALMKHDEAFSSKRYTRKFCVIVVDCTNQLITEQVKMPLNYTSYVTNRTQEYRNQIARYQ